MISVQQKKTVLINRLEELGVRLVSIEGELESHNNPDWEERATEREVDEVLEALGNQGDAEVVAIRAALGRIESRDYGTCTICGDEISEARLDALPATPFCSACAAH